MMTNSSPVYVTEEARSSVFPAGQDLLWLCSMGHQPHWSIITSTMQSWSYKVRSDHFFMTSSVPASCLFSSRGTWVPKSRWKLVRALRIMTLIVNIVLKATLLQAQITLDPCSPLISVHRGESLYTDTSRTDNGSFFWQWAMSFPMHWLEGDNPVLLILTVYVSILSDVPCHFLTGPQYLCQPLL